MSVESKIKRLPVKPGVYLMKDASGVVLYVGKAKNLRIRVRSYLRPEGDGRAHVRFLMARTRDLDWVVTDSEKEALILENNLIKKHRPRYNVDLRDDKTYLSLRLSVADEFPKLTMVRRIANDGALYFGPYSSARDLRATIELLQKVFPMRSCSAREFSSRTRPCLFHKTRGCSAPCCGLIDKASYAEMVDEVILFLKGKNDELTKRLKEEMSAAAVRQDFEEAALVRDRLRAVEATLERQKVVTHSRIDRDVLGWVREGGEAQFAVLVVRSGQVIDRRGYYLGGPLNEDDGEVVSEFIRRYYRGQRIVPNEVILPVDPGSDEREVLELWLGERRKRKVRLHTPRRGEKLELLKMASANAAELLVERRKSKVGFEAALEELARRIGMDAPPKRIECFDVSNFQGREAVAGMISFKDGFPYKPGYRRFTIKTIDGADDYAMLHEALTRRFTQDPERKKKQPPLPDLLVIDGGRGQLSAALKALEDAGVENQAVIGLAKARTLSGDVTGGARESVRSMERIFLPGRKNPVVPPRNSSAIFLLQRVRDEAHRFSIEFHRKLRKKRHAASELDEVPGVGPNRRKALLRHFGSLKKIKAATASELGEVGGVSTVLARVIEDFFNAKG